MTIAMVVVAVLCVAAGLRWRKLRRDARRRRWSYSSVLDSSPSSGRIRIVGQNHTPTESIQPIVPPKLENAHRYVFGDVDGDATGLNTSADGRDRALARAGRRRRKSRSSRRRY